MQKQIEKVLEDSEVVSSWNKVKDKKLSELLMFEFKADIRDGSELRIKEIWQGDERLRYGYFWIKGGRVLMGWNNSPHHPKLITYPFHAHRGGKVIEWGEVDVQGVIKCIAEGSIC
ncbi:MAG: DUF6516 family protein [Actinomycetota bacterium]|nr:DUF6516 family protein [Actinomycetota bacterium]